MTDRCMFLLTDVGFGNILCSIIQLRILQRKSELHLTLWHILGLSVTLTAIVALSIYSGKAAKQKREQIHGWLPVLSWEHLLEVLRRSEPHSLPINTE